MVRVMEIDAQQAASSLHVHASSSGVSAYKTEQSKQGEVAREARKLKEPVCVLEATTLGSSRRLISFFVHSGCSHK